MATRKKELVLSVHQLVDFLLRTGDIDNRVFNRTSMSEGSLIHSLYQSKQGDNYISEYPLKTVVVVDEIPVTIQGRADGIIIKGKDYTIDEKTKSVSLTEEGSKKVESLCHIKNLYDLDNAAFVHHLNQA